METDLKALIARNTDAVISQSTTNEKLVTTLERLDARLAVQSSEPLSDPRILAVKLVVVAAVAALVASCTVIAWGAL